MVYRVFVEKKKPFAVEAKALLSDIRGFLGIKSVTDVRIINRYDVENITGELFSRCISGVFAEAQLDTVSDTLKAEADSAVFAAEYLPGQFDQRADSAAQCIQIISQGERPNVRSARVYVLTGNPDEAELTRIKDYVINPVESRAASLALPETLVPEYTVPEKVASLSGFRELDESTTAGFLEKYGLAMDADDLIFCRDYFRGEQRDPTVTELRVIDTYWSDHCRHTTFLTEIDSVSFEDAELEKTYQSYLETRKKLGRTKPVTLMDIGTLAAKALAAEGKLDALDESEEINACTVKIKVNTESGEEDWLLLFKNETHNHPTEIEPFGGAATCIGGAIRDPLSGRAYVYAAMRVTGAADPTVPVSSTIPGKLPQKKLVTTAAAGYSSYGNQIGLATCQVDEIYHPGYAAKRMEIGAVVAATPAANVRRERPVPSDIVILLGGKTGRDGCGGATGSSKSHTASSLETCGAEVQKGNAPEERKLQRLFRNREAAQLIKRCNDFGAGGVSVAIGELADGLDIDLDAVPKKYNGLDGTELAISESQERMAVVVSAGDAEHFSRLAAAENLEATIVARVKAEPRLTMSWRGDTIVDITREFLDSNGAKKHITIAPSAPKPFARPIPQSFCAGMKALCSDLNFASKRGLSERFDSTIGAGTVLMPFGGSRQLTPTQAMVNKISLEHGDTTTCSYMAYGCNPFIIERDPAAGAYLAVVESLSKLISAGADREQTYLSFQEYFEKPRRDPARWGKPLAALLGAFRAQTELGVAAIGGKDSMSGSFEELDVPPTLVSFAVTADSIDYAVSPEFKGAGHRVVMLSPEYDEKGIPSPSSLIALFDTVSAMVRRGEVLAAYTPCGGGVADAIFKMALGNNIGFAYEASELKDIFSYRYGSFIMELADTASDCGTLLGHTTAEAALTLADESAPLDTLLEIYEGVLEGVYSCNNKQGDGSMIPSFNFNAEAYPSPAVRCPKPKMLIPVFPGTNCEYDSVRALERAGIEAETVVIRNLSAADIEQSVSFFADRIKTAQGIFIPGGFSGGDEPEGSGKFITAFFRSAAVRDATMELLDCRGGLMLGICNGFQALIKLGLVPYGRITDTDESSPTLTFNTIGRHQSRLVRTRVASNKSPWLMKTQPGEIYTVPVSHGEGRFVAPEGFIKALAENGQLATQYADINGIVTSAIDANPNDSMLAVEAITSPDGRVLGKMGHSERVGSGLYKNVPGRYNMGLFESFAEYYK